MIERHLMEQNFVQAKLEEGGDPFNPFAYQIPTALQQNSDYCKRARQEDVREEEKKGSHQKADKGHSAVRMR